jgi:hypothetical protein
MKHSATGGEATAEQSTLPQFLHPGLPLRYTGTQPIKDPGQIRRDCGFARANRVKYGMFSPDCFDIPLVG